jgi:hypothetical protein
MPAEHACPVCGAMNNQGRASCTSCGAALDWSAGPVAAAAAVASEVRPPTEKGGVRITSIDISWGNAFDIVWKTTWVSVGIGLLLGGLVAMLYMMVSGSSTPGY